MAEKAEKKVEAPPAAEKKGDAKPAAGGGGLMSKMPVLVGGVMFLEAVVLFAGFKFLGGGAHSASGADLTTQAVKTADGDKSAATTPGKDDVVELPLLDMKFPNKISGRMFLYDVSIFVTVKSDRADAFKKIIGDRDALIKDRVRTIIAQSDPEKLGGGSEPGLETLRRQVKYQLDEVCGEGMVEEVLVPRCIPYRTDF